MAKWFVTTKRADFQAMAAKYQIDPVVARIIRNREIAEERIEDFLYPTLSSLHDPYSMKDMEQGVSLILEKIAEKKKFRVIGDYDIDGICSAYILKRGLTLLGADVTVVIPHRIKDGYGLNESLILEAKQEGTDCMITCDNGIAAYEQIRYAKELGMTVIITDHHEVPYEESEGKKEYLLPPADAIIDPKRDDCTYPFKGICGGVVAYKVVLALFACRGLDATGLSEELLEIAAFATVGDIMELRDENRTIVKYGLQAMQQTKNIGLQALIEVNGLAGKKLSPYHLGFILGPCLNATGRLDSAERAIRLLEAVDRAEAVLIAGDLKAMNDSRKELTAAGVEAAIRQVEEENMQEDNILVLYLPDCHESLAGIIAGRIKERYGRPALVLTKGETEVKGSARSIEAYSLYEEMSRHKELFLKFGGHKLAAGLSMKEEHIKELRKRMNEACRLTKEDREEKIHIDVAMPFSYLTMELIKQIELLEPFGNANPKPIFAQKNIQFQKETILGKTQNVAKFLVADEDGNKITAMYFGDIQELHRYITEKCGKEEQTNLLSGKATTVTLSIIYVPTINEYRGMTEMQLVIQDYQ